MRQGLPPGLVAALFLAAALAPLALAALSGEPPEALPTEMGIGLGLAALALMVLQFAHSGRFETLSGRIGIDRTMRLHRAAALALFTMALLHPIAFVFPALLSAPSHALEQLWRLLTRPRMATGVAALACLALLVALSLARHRLRLPYQIWRSLHAGLGLAAVGFAVEHALSVGLYSEGEALRAVWLAGLGLAIGALVWTWGVKPLLGARQGWRVAGVRRIGDGYWELVLNRPSGAPLAFAAGQFAWLAVGRRAPWDDNPFSIASAPGERDLAFVVREAGDFTRSLHRLAPGTPVRVDGPHGAFRLDGGETRAILLIAGGAGIAPVLAIWRHLARAGHPAPVRLIYGAQVATKLLYREELSATAAARGFGLTLRVEDGELPEGVSRGRIDRAVLTEALRGLDPRRTLALICGPRPMMLAVAGELEALGLPPSAILYEAFVYD